ncbi:hypothetical protein [Brevundimonas diminuta]|uniref:hypothetical protein n=1 Tax=Brevundimonas diminuta TaxID=293 RepID=UPI00137870F4|nr:hypothetical protein [Brevundimonas diminuta]
MYVVLGLVQAAFALVALLWVCPLIANPRQNYEFYYKREDAMSRAERWRHYLRWGCVFIGLLILFYHASGALLSWIPYSWGSLDEDGEWQALAPSARGLAAFVGAGCFMQVFEARVESAAKHVVEEHALIELLDTLSKPVWRDETAETLRERLLKTAGSALTNTDRAHLDGKGVRDYREWLGRRIR